MFEKRRLPVQAMILATYSSKISPDLRKKWTSSILQAREKEMLSVGIAFRATIELPLSPVIIGEVSRVGNSVDVRIASGYLPQIISRSDIIRLSAIPVLIPPTVPSSPLR